MCRQLTACVLVVSLLTLPIVSGCQSKVTKSNYDKIRTGMTLAEVEDILGKGELQSGGSGGLGGITGSAKAYKWEDGEKSITVTFLNDKVTLKAQSGL